MKIILQLFSIFTGSRWKRNEFKAEGPKEKCLKIVVFENGYIICRQLIISDQTYGIKDASNELQL